MRRAITGGDFPVMSKDYEHEPSTTVRRIDGSCTSYIEHIHELSDLSRTMDSDSLSDEHLEPATSVSVSSVHSRRFFEAPPED